MLITKKILFDGMITVPLSGSASTLIEVSFRNIRLTICHVIGERKRGTYGGAICRRNEQKSSIYFVLAFLRLVVRRSIVPVLAR